jgi:hypothetical protein
MITVERRSPRRTFTTQPWCVLENGKVLAECRSQAAAERIRAALAIEQKARRLLKALDRLDIGTDEPGFAGWENGNGTQVGDEIEAARKSLAKEINHQSRHTKP